MTRSKLPDRRPSVTVRAMVTLDNKEFMALLTIGFRDSECRIPAEVFCSSFKFGTSLNAMTSDACVLLSRLYQHGDNPQSIAEGLCQPHSLVGQIASVVAGMVAGEKL